MSLILDVLKAFGVGVVSFYAVGFLAAAILPWDDAEDIVDVYVGMATSTLKRCLLVKRSHGGWKLKKTEFDAGLHGEVTKLGGEAHSWRDYYNHMSKWNTATFGLAHEDKNAIFDARVADLGRRYRELKESGRWMVDGKRKAHFVVDGLRHVVNLDEAMHVIPGSASPRLADRVDDDIEKSQAMFNSRRGQIAQTIEMLMFFGVGFGAVYLANKLGGSGGGTISTVELGILPLISTGPASVRQWLDKHDVDVRGFAEQVAMSLGLLGLGAGLGIAAYASQVIPTFCPTTILSTGECTPYVLARTYAKYSVLGGGLLLVAVVVPDLLPKGDDDE